MGKRQTLITLQGLRFFAALLVVIGHVQAEAIRTFPSFTGFSAYPWAVGVDIFFAISGFVMIITTEGKTGSISDARTFLYRRFLRIAPLYWIFTSLAVAFLLAAHKAISWPEIVTSYVFIPWSDIPIDNRATPVLSVGWTINHEMMFYFLFGLAMLLPRKLSVVALSGILVGLVGLHTTISKSNATLYTWTNPIILEFAAGMILGLIYQKNVRISSTIATLATLLSLALLSVFPEPTQWRPLLWGIPAFLIVAMIVLAPDISEKHYLSYWLKLGGDASYAIYLSHIFTLNIMSRIWDKLPARDVASLYIIGAIIASVAAGIIVHIFIERPITKFLNTQTRKPRFQQTATEAA